MQCLQRPFWSFKDVDIKNKCPVGGGIYQQRNYHYSFSSSFKMWLQLGSDSDIEPSLQQSDPSYWGLIMMQLCSVQIINCTPPLDTCSVQAGEIICDVVIYYTVSIPFLFLLRIIVKFFNPCLFQFAGKKF